MENMWDTKNIINKFETELTKTKIDKKDKDLILYNVKSIISSIEELQKNWEISQTDKKVLEDASRYLEKSLTLLKQIAENPENNREEISTAIMQQIFSRDYMLANAGVIIVQKGEALYNVLSKYNMRAEKHIQWEKDKTQPWEAKFVDRNAQLLIKLKQTPWVEIWKDNIPNINLENMKFEDQLAVFEIAIEYLSTNPEINKDPKLLEAKQRLEEAYKQIQIELWKQITPEDVKSFQEQWIKLANKNIKDPSTKDKIVNWFNSLDTWEKIAAVIITWWALTVGSVAVIWWGVLLWAWVATSVAGIGTIGTLWLTCNLLGRVPGWVRWFLLWSIPHSTKAWLTNLLNWSRDYVAYTIAWIAKDVRNTPWSVVAFQNYVAKRNN